MVALWMVDERDEEEKEERKCEGPLNDKELGRYRHKSLL